jgi:hypothetical protein
MEDIDENIYPSPPLTANENLKIKEFIKARQATFTWKQKLHYKLLSIRFKIEDKFKIKLGWLYPTIRKS